MYHPMIISAFAHLSYLVVLELERAAESLLRSKLGCLIYDILVIPTNCE